MTGPIERFLEVNGAIWRDTHVVFTSGKHSSEYFDIRQVSHDADFMSAIGRQIASRIEELKPDIIIGPRTVGQTLADYTGFWIPGVWAIWCEIVEEGEGADKTRTPLFSTKTKYGRLLKDKRVVGIDDLLTTGSSLELTRQLVEEYGGIFVGAITVVRRNSQTEELPGIPWLGWLEDIKGAPAQNPEDCTMCADEVPMVIEVGHGKSWIVDHPDYPVAPPRE